MLSEHIYGDTLFVWDAGVEEQAMPYVDSLGVITVLTTAGGTGATSNVGRLDHDVGGYERSKRTRHIQVGAQPGAVGVVVARRGLVSSS